VAGSGISALRRSTFEGGTDYFIPRKDGDHPGCRPGLTPCWSGWGGRSVGARVEPLNYFLQQSSANVVLTNLANGKSVTAVVRLSEKTLRVTDNGDGTLTVVNLSTGNFVLYGETGKAIARNPGQVRFAFLVDHAGTPADPFDHELIAELGMVKGSTGRSDDFCSAVVPALT
jgi:hypothetical protein